MSDKEEMCTEMKMVKIGFGKIGVLPTIFIGDEDGNKVYRSAPELPGMMQRAICAAEMIVKGPVDLQLEILLQSKLAATLVSHGYYFSPITGSPGSIILVIGCGCQIFGTSDMRSMLKSVSPDGTDNIPQEARDEIETSFIELNVARDEAILGMVEEGESGVSPES